MTRLWLKARLPSPLFDRLALTIYGFEFFERFKPYKDYVEPQLRAKPTLKGSGKSFVLVTSGRFEFHTWDAEFAREVTSRPKDFRQFDAASVLLGIFGQNVLTTDGSEWSRHRRIVAGAVTERVSSVVWNEAIRQTQDCLTSITSTETDELTGSGTTYHMFDCIKRIAIHVIYAAGMGKKQDFILNENDNINPESGDTKLPGMKLSYIDAVKIINVNTSGPNIIPMWILQNWPSWFPGAAWLHSIADAKLEFPIHTRAELAREREIAAKTGETRNNVMSALIAASERNEGVVDTEKGTPDMKKGPALTDQEVVANLYIFTAAGFDTTANTLAYALVLLCRHPQWQDWIITEIDSLIPDPNTTDIDYTSVFPRAYRLQALMLETLRLFPPIVHILKMTQAPQTITTSSAGTFTLPAQSTVCVNSIALHTDPAVWRDLNPNTDTTPQVPNPDSKAEGENTDKTPDELNFRPSRWLDSPTQLYHPPKGTYLPWSAGPRVCPGQKMAQVEFVAVILTLFLKHRLEPIRRRIGEDSGDGKEESDEQVRDRLDALMERSQPILTLEMDVYDIKKGEEGKRGLGVSWVSRR